MFLRTRTSLFLVLAFFLLTRWWSASPQPAVQKLAAIIRTTRLHKRLRDGPLRRGATRNRLCLCLSAAKDFQR